MWTVQLAGCACTVCGGLCGCAVMSSDPRFDVGELGEIDMVSRALAALDLVTNDAARPGFWHVHYLPRTPGGKVDYQAVAGPAGGPG